MPSNAVSGFGEGKVFGRRPKQEKKSAYESVRADVAQPSDNGQEKQLSLFQAAVDSDAVQWLMGLLNAIWAKLLEQTEKLVAIVEKMGQIEKDLNDKPNTAPVRDYYTSKTFPPVVEGRLKAETVATYLLQGKLLGFKTQGGRGESGEWRLSHEEYLRYEAEGLLGKKKRPPKSPSLGFAER